MGIWEDTAGMNTTEYINHLIAHGEDVSRKDISDGNHTFGELYNHRAVLFAVVCNNNPMAWKSLRHDTGEMFDGMFIVGIETPQGQATYHYNLEHWDMFKVPELEKAPEFDGHTPDDVLHRLQSLF